ncbi:MAG: hypothetical protein ACTHXA_06600 [Gulosibacter sp.]|uniref:hypothetical protein n=1 Tax=Gulosibacter sp. TaxID=2817531 RepID=UPI003F8E6A27
MLDEGRDLPTLEETTGEPGQVARRRNRSIRNTAIWSGITFLIAAGLVVLTGWLFFTPSKMLSSPFEGTEVLCPPLSAGVFEPAHMSSLQIDNVTEALDAYEAERGLESDIARSLRYEDITEQGPLACAVVRDNRQTAFFFSAALAAGAIYAFVRCGRAWMRATADR